MTKKKTLRRKSASEAAVLHRSGRGCCSLNFSSCQQVYPFIEAMEELPRNTEEISVQQFMGNVVLIKLAKHQWCNCI